MGNWADDAFERWKAQQEERTLNKQVLVAIDRIKHEQAPILWREIVTALQQEAKAFNDKTGKQLLSVGGSDPLMVSYSDDEGGLRRIPLRFDKKACAVVVEDPLTTWTLKVGNSGQARFMNEGTAVAPSEIAAEVLNRLLFGK